MQSLRRTLIASTVAAVTSLLLVSGMLVYLLVRSDLLRQLDRPLESEARLLTSTLEYERGRLSVELHELDMSDFGRTARPAYLQLWRAGGAVLYRSPSRGQKNLPLLDDAGSAAHYRPLSLPDGRRGRAVELTCLPRHDAEEHESGRGDAAVPRIRAVLARDTADGDRVLARLSLILAIIGALATALSGGGPDPQPPRPLRSGAFTGEGDCRRARRHRRRTVKRRRRVRSVTSPAGRRHPDSPHLKGHW
ncbi:MAG: hypothetical protein COY42_13455 [Armatimonadetes bacterium CG_4_10_14_0_8_um_filter_66_14]|nr:hypothetical protein [Armatimonadota bacterium]OIO98037.1 MAG: hypothetical protein AUJ96_21940 [Armatimonadetes bacterium CG2_30_66_41]PIU87970.1 MAG: hypothetical protein COS65_31965 [Armatimonadetes bacterium CG06_land_8_20_14_3_00_66_21]PIZ44732.1 MAG: hypothetical protein COY42_13455 [Armatimonadetes bacterium CG_4_10_14_0_8_um_filter_66_14]PJB61166.1 MAG: hypothetical protein CO096_30225 [Armatimonadetes bacterium CG_4_9_14_3_um_filter_66_14]